MQKEPALFISDTGFIDYTIPGGVQLCTNEFLEYLEVAGFDVKIIKVTPVLDAITRIRKKLHLETYELYKADKWLAEIVSTINNEQIKLVFFNQLNLAGWTESIRSHVSADVKFIGLSHGNESGDYLHEIARESNTSKLKIYRLGKLLLNENIIFSELLDGVITISDIEININQWLGARKLFFIPRILKEDFINWQPEPNCIGFVGTLDHLPNERGIELLAIELQKLGFKGTLKLVGGPQSQGYKLEHKYSFIKYCGALSNQQLAAEMSSWCIFLNPVFWYARGASTKLALAINYGLPCVTTPAGCRGYELSNQDIVCSENTVTSFAQMVTHALKNPKLIKRLKHGSEQNAKDFNPEKHTLKLKEFIQEILCSN